MAKYTCTYKEFDLIQLRVYPCKHYSNIVYHKSVVLNIQSCTLKAFRKQHNILQKYKRSSLWGVTLCSLSVNHFLKQIIDKDEESIILTFQIWAVALSCCLKRCYLSLTKVSSLFLDEVFKMWSDCMLCQHWSYITVFMQHCTFVTVSTSQRHCLASIKAN